MFQAHCTAETIFNYLEPYCKWVYLIVKKKLIKPRIEKCSKKRKFSRTIACWIHIVVDICFQFDSTWSTVWWPNRTLWTTCGSFQIISNPFGHLYCPKFSDPFESIKWKTLFRFWFLLLEYNMTIFQPNLNLHLDTFVVLISFDVILLP